MPTVVSMPGYYELCDSMLKFDTCFDDAKEFIEFVKRFCEIIDYSEHMTINRIKDRFICKIDIFVIKSFKERKLIEKESEKYKSYMLKIFSNCNSAKEGILYLTYDKRN